MITITEARAKTNSSSAALAVLIESIGVQIEKAANNNKSMIVLDDCINLPEFLPEINGYFHLDMGSLRILNIQAALKPYGFQIVMEKIQHTVGGGFKGTGEKSKEEVWQHYVIRW
jgi:hypothetical protein